MKLVEETCLICSFVGMNAGVNTKEDYEKYSYNLKEKDENYSLYHF